MLGHHTQTTTYARPPRPTLMQRLRGRRTARTTGRRGVTKAPLVTNRAGHPTSSTYATATTHDSHSRHAAPRHTRAGHAGPTARRAGFWKKKTVVRQQRKPTMGDKLSGAMLKLKGSLTGRPGKKAAGTRRMHGTDGRGSRRVY